MHQSSNNESRIVGATMPVLALAIAIFRKSRGFASRAAPRSSSASDRIFRRARADELYGHLKPALLFACFATFAIAGTWQAIVDEQAARAFLADRSCSLEVTARVARGACRLEPAKIVRTFTYRDSADHFIIDLRLRDGRVVSIDDVDQPSPADDRARIANGAEATAEIFHGTVVAVRVATEAFSTKNAPANKVSADVRGIVIPIIGTGMFVAVAMMLFVSNRIEHGGRKYPGA